VLFCVAADTLRKQWFSDLNDDNLMEIRSDQNNPVLRRDSIQYVLKKYHAHHKEMFHVRDPAMTMENLFQIF